MNKTISSVRGGPVVLEGVLDKIIYSNQSNNFTVARLKVEGRIDPVTIVGTLTSPVLGEVLRLQGEWVIDPRFGEQFRIASCLSVLPCTISGIEKYLGSGLIYGIGKVMARRIVNKFGLKTLDIIDKYPEKLREVEGIGPVRIQEIVQSWRGQKDIREVMIFLEGQGISPTYAAKIFKTYGNQSVAVLRENPYRLAMDIKGISFKTADKIAQNMGIPPGSQTRVESGIIHTLTEQAEAGHTYYPYSELSKTVFSLLRTEKLAINKALDALVEQGRIIIEDWNDQLAVYLSELYEAEIKTAEGLQTTLKTPRQPLNIDMETAIESVQKKNGIELDELQKEALKKALRSKALIITGGPGTGKTTLMNSLIRILEGQRQKIILASPTGRAAKHLSEVTGKEASTLHRLLEYNPEDEQFKRNSNNPLEADWIIVDEMSMIDILLMSSLCEAMTPETVLVMIGDVDQLSSVGPGNVLRDLIDSGRIETVRLKTIFRQAQQSLIVVNAHRINEGKFPVTRVFEAPASDFYYVESKQPQDVLEIIKDLCSRRLPQEFGLNPMEDVQVVTPMYAGIVGVDNLNMELQRLLNPERRSILHQGRTFRFGDKVMQIRNNYDKEIYNGDVGRIVEIDVEGQRILIKFDERTIDYSFDDLNEVVLSYAITIHKSQGSEYPAVILPMVYQQYIMLQRNLLYTAVTRARQLMIIIGSKQALSIAIRNNKVQQRYTGLKSRLSEA